LVVLVVVGFFSMSMSMAMAMSLLGGEEAIMICVFRIGLEASIGWRRAG
jgi:hypothetical protein